MRRHAEDPLDGPSKIDSRRPRLDQNISILSKQPPRLGKIASPNLLERQDETIGSDDPDQWRSPNLHRLDGITDLVQTPQPDIGQPSREESLVQRLQHIIPPPDRLQTLTSHCNSGTSPTPFYLNGFIAAQAPVQLSETLGSKNRADTNRCRSARGLSVQGGSIPPRTGKADGSPRESVRHADRRKDQPQPLRDLLPRREEKDQSPRREDETDKITTAARDQTLCRKTHDMDKISRLPRPQRPGIPGPGRRGRLRFRELRKRSHETPRLHRLRRRRIHTRETGKTIREGEQGRKGSSSSRHRPAHRHSLLHAESGKLPRTIN